MLELSNLILKIPKLVTDNECDELTEFWNDESKHAFREKSYNTLTRRTVPSTMKVKYIDPNTFHYNLAVTKMEQALKLWIDHLDTFSSFSVDLIRANLNYPRSVRLLKYDIGDSIHPHSDFADFNYASCTLNLNDDYQGGEFCFFNKKFNIQLGKGDALVFPNNHFYVHEVTEITQGSRFSINSFISNIPDDKIKGIFNLWNIPKLANSPNKTFKI